MKTFVRNIVESAVSYVYEDVSLDNDYIKSKTNQFMKQACMYSDTPNNPWLKSEITENAIRDTAWGMLDTDCSDKLFRILGVSKN